MNNIARALDPVGAAAKEAAEKDAQLGGLVEKRSPQELERIDDLKAAHRLGLSFGLEPHEVEAALLNAMKNKRLMETSRRITSAQEHGITK